MSPGQAAKQFKQLPLHSVIYSDSFARPARQSTKHACAQCIDIPIKSENDRVRATTYPIGMAHGLMIGRVLSVIPYGGRVAFTGW